MSKLCLMRSIYSIRATPQTIREVMKVLYAPHLQFGSDLWAELAYLLQPEKFGMVTVGIRVFKTKQKSLTQSDSTTMGNRFNLEHVKAL
jgi:hypothetical protein